MIKHKDQNPYTVRSILLLYYNLYTKRCENIMFNNNSLNVSVDIYDKAQGPKSIYFKKFSMILLSIQQCDDEMPNYIIL